MKIMCNRLFIYNNDNLHYFVMLNLHFYGEFLKFLFVPSELYASNLSRSSHGCDIRVYVTVNDVAGLQLVIKFVSTV
jgi:hypothetical protein